MDKKATSQASWALITEGVTQARLEAHRLRHQIERVLRIIEDSKQKEEIYQVAGDVVVGVPKRLEGLELALDRTSLALVKMGEDFLSARLPLEDKTLVEEASTSAFGKSQFDDSVKKVAVRFLEAIREK
jgi:hypothetical protein